MSADLQIVRRFATDAEFRVEFVKDPKATLEFHGLHLSDESLVALLDVARISDDGTVYSINKYGNGWRGALAIDFATCDIGV